MLMTADGDVRVPSKTYHYVRLWQLDTAPAHPYSPSSALANFAGAIVEQ